MLDVRLIKQSKSCDASFTLFSRFKTELPKKAKLDFRPNPQLWS